MLDNKFSINILIKVKYFNVNPYITLFSLKYIIIFVEPLIFNYVFNVTIFY